MTTMFEVENCIEKEREDAIANNEGLIMKKEAKDFPGKGYKRPEWQERSPILDVFVRYGEYFS